MTVRQLSTGAGEYELRDDQLFAGYEQELFSHVVTLAEKEGKSVELLVVPAVDPFDALVQTATSLRASKLVVGVSPRMESDELAHRIGLAWERQPPPRHPFSLEITHPDRPSTYVNLGPHPPRLWPEDVDLSAQHLAAPDRAGRGRLASCIIATWWAWRCSGWKKSCRAAERRRILEQVESAVHRHEGGDRGSAAVVGRRLGRSLQRLVGMEVFPVGGDPVRRNIVLRGDQIQPAVTNHGMETIFQRVLHAGVPHRRRVGLRP